MDTVSLLSKLESLTNREHQQVCEDQLMLLKEYDRFNHFAILKCSEINEVKSQF